MSSEAKPLETPVVVPAVDAAVEKPVEPIAVPAVIEPTTAAPATTAPVVIDAPASVEEPATAIGASLTDAVEHRKNSITVEPITEGLLAYKAPAKFPLNLIPGRDHKYFFWFGDEAIPAEKLSSFTSSTNHHEAAAWSSETGKGLLYYANNAESKDSPVGVLPLSEVTNIKESGGLEFSFKIAEHKHTFIASSASERSAWLLTLKAEIEAATGKKEEIHGSEGFKKTLASLAPAAIVAGSHNKKSAEGERTTREEKISKDKAKTRSVSRGKGIFDRFNKKDAAPKDETVATEPAVVEPVVPATEPIAPVEATETLVFASTEAAPVIAAATAVEETKPETAEDKTAPVANRRASRFGDFFKKVTSPTTEKKEAEVVPLAAATDAPVTETAEIAPVVPALETTEAAAAPVDTAAATSEVVTPTREKKKFTLPNLFEKKAKAPGAEAPAADADARAIADHAVSAEVVPDTTETAVAPTAASPVEKSEKRRSSFFSGDILAGSIKKLGGKTKKEETPAATTETETVPAAAATTTAVEEPIVAPAAATETAAPEVVAPAATEDATETKEEKEDLKSKVSSLGRRISVALRGSKDRKPSPAPPAKVEEGAEKETATAPISAEAPQIEAPKDVEPAALSSTDPPAIGDVVPEAITVGNEPIGSSRVVSATA